MKSLDDRTAFPDNTAIPFCLYSATLHETTYLKAVMADFSFSGWIASEWKVHFKHSLKEQFQSLFLYCKPQEIIKKTQPINHQTCEDHV